MLIRQFCARHCRHLHRTRRAGRKTKSELSVASSQTQNIKVWSFVFILMQWEDGESLCGTMWTLPVYCPVVNHQHSCTYLHSWRCLHLTCFRWLVYQAVAGFRSPTLNLMNQNFPMGNPIRSVRIKSWGSSSRVPIPWSRITWRCWCCQPAL